jgi:hypothetical protein
MLQELIVIQLYIFLGIRVIYVYDLENIRYIVERDKIIALQWLGNI